MHLRVTPRSPSGLCRPKGGLSCKTVSKQSERDTVVALLLQHHRGLRFSRKRDDYTCCYWIRQCQTSTRYRHLLGVSRGQPCLNQRRRL